MNKEWKRLYEEAMSVLNPHDVSNRMWVGSVASAVLTKKGNIYKEVITFPEKTFQFTPSSNPSFSFSPKKNTTHLGGVLAVVFRR